MYILYYTSSEPEATREAHPLRHARIKATTTAPCPSICRCIEWGSSSPSKTVRPHPKAENHCELVAFALATIHNDDDGTIITVVTSAANVRVGSRVAVAPVGSTVETDDGSLITIQKTTVGGVVSEGMLCDSRMLGWTGGAAGVAVQIPDSIDIGACPPHEKPRGNFATTEQSDAAAAIPAVEVKPLFEKKLTKEEKKKLAEEKRKAKKAAKEAASE